MPASSSEVLPAPDCEYSTTSRRDTISDVNSGISTLRPKNKSCSAVVKGFGPTYGFWEPGGAGCSGIGWDVHLLPEPVEEIGAGSPEHDDALVLHIPLE